MRAGSLLYSKHNTIDFINRCREMSIGILGIDALLISEDITEPNMANSIDFTATPHLQNVPSNIWDAAISFLEEIDDKYYFEVICSE